MRTYDLGASTVHAVKANPIEEAVAVGAMADRSIFALDVRQKVPLKRVGFAAISFVVYVSM